MKDALKKKAEEAGANTSADMGVFLIGAPAGGLADAAINAFGFAEPMVVAGLTGSGALGLRACFKNEIAHLWAGRRRLRRCSSVAYLRICSLLAP